MKGAENYKSYATLSYLIGWGLLALLIFLLIPLSYGVVLPGAYWINQAVFFFSLMGLTYFNEKVLAPKYLFKKKFIFYYSLLLLVCLMVIALLWMVAAALNLGELIHYALRPGQAYQPKGTSGYMYFYIFFLEISVLGISITILILRKWLNEEKLRLETEEKNTSMELAYLKAQINPHFFFNSLNTINALTYKDIENSRQALSKLSHIMRYVLYDTQQKSVLLKKEIDFIEDYIALTRLRVSLAVKIDLEIDVNAGNKLIAPMLLLPFIENCFKHGISSKQTAAIFIKIILKDNVLSLITKNNIIQKPASSEEFGSGIGLSNTIRRLDLLYRGKYELKINQDSPKDEYWVDFKIEVI